MRACDVPVKISQQQILVPMSSRARLRNAARRMHDGPAWLRLYRVAKPRSLTANRYYFGAVVRTIADDLGYADPEEMHDIIAFKFLRIEDDKITGAPRRLRTRSMSSEAFAAYINTVKLWAEADLHIRIESPEEYYARCLASGRDALRP